MAMEQHRTVQTRQCSRGSEPRAIQIDEVRIYAIRENQPALRLYSRLGFVEYGVERNALKQDGRYYDERLMVAMLR